MLLSDIAKHLALNVHFSATPPTYVLDTITVLWTACNEAPSTSLIRLKWATPRGAHEAFPSVLRGAAGPLRWVGPHEGSANKMQSMDVKLRKTGSAIAAFSTSKGGPSHPLALREELTRWSRRRNSLRNEGCARRGVGWISV
ncbi:hypothetical protein VTN77DRAFT_8145 [Rasamsonia byssochlamydoides]|uniref:uncharacterized protein n=1 Tax=Rasamsonia byssochlamydoides TaxID=89139 RepID=UPI003743D21F